MVPHLGNEISFDTFVIVSATSNILNLDKVFFEKRLRYYCTKKVSTHIVDTCKETVLSLINLASNDFRRDQMWTEQSDWV